MENCATIMAILQEHRVETAAKVQDVLTRYGCYIKVRLGLHDAGIDSCSPSGLILLQLCGEAAKLQELSAELQALDHVKVKTMDLNF